MLRLNNLKGGTYLSLFCVMALSSMTALAGNPDEIAHFLETNSCEKCDLTGAEFGRKLDFNEAKLKGANFAGTALPNNSTFDGADLSGADLSGVSSLNNTFFKAKLIGTDFRGARLRQPSFDGADLTGADFTNAKIMNIGFQEDLDLLFDEEVAAILCNTKMPDGTINNRSCP